MISVIIKGEAVVALEAEVYELKEAVDADDADWECCVFCEYVTCSLGSLVGVDLVSGFFWARCSGLRDVDKLSSDVFSSSRVFFLFF